MDPRDNKAFTLIEILIVLAISIMLSSIAITYSGISQNQNALSVQESQVAQTILFAKNLATAAYINDPSVCGYGVLFDTSADTYSIFQYTPQKTPTNNCPDISAVATSTLYFTSVGGNATNTEPYSASTWNVPLARGVHFVSSAGDTLSAVLFYPPQPTTALSVTPDAYENGAALGADGGTVYLETTDGSQSASIPVNLSGQVDL